MPLNFTQKQNLVKEMTAVLSDAEVVLTADYSGLTANELNELRKSTREAGVFVKLVKNNMLKMALKESQFSSMSENIFGPQIIAVGKACGIPSYGNVLIGFVEVVNRKTIWGAIFITLHQCCVL